MSSDPRFAAISPAGMEMIKAVLKSAGYDATLLSGDERQYNTAAFLVMRLFLEGETSADALAAHLKRRLGKASSPNRSYQSRPVLEVIRGIPRNTMYILSFFMRARDRSIGADEQSWENEGGALGNPVGRPLIVRSRSSQKGAAGMTDH